MNSEKLKQALQETRDEQHKNRRIELKNEQLAYEKCPALVKLVNDRRNLIRESVISALSGGVPENIEIRMDELNRSINKELRAAGLPENQFEAVYTCELCADTGYVGKHKKSFANACLQGTVSCLLKAIPWVTATKHLKIMMKKCFQMN